VEKEEEMEEVMAEEKEVAERAVVEMVVEVMVDKKEVVSKVVAEMVVEEKEVDKKEECVEVHSEEYKVEER
jgi:hypothetical protein